MVYSNLQVSKLEHHIHSHYEKSIIERTMQYIKDRTDGLTTTFHVEGKIAN